MDFDLGDHSIRSKLNNRIVKSDVTLVKLGGKTYIKEFPVRYTILIFLGRLGDIATSSHFTRKSKDCVWTHLTTNGLFHENALKCINIEWSTQIIKLTIKIQSWNLKYKTSQVQSNLVSRVKENGRQTPALSTWQNICMRAHMYSSKVYLNKRQRALVEKKSPKNNTSTSSINLFLMQKYKN